MPHAARYGRFGTERLEPFGEMLGFVPNDDFERIADEANTDP